jgi:histidine phosphotransfer protein HptB
MSNASGTPISVPIISTLARDADMAELIDMYVDEMKQRADVLRSTHDQKNWAVLVNEVHKIRGSAGGHGFKRLGDAAGALEDMIRMAKGKEETIAQDVKTQVDELISMCLRTRAR